MKTIFLDRDGVINRNRDDYVKSWNEFEFLPGALDALCRLAQLRYRVVVVTNQSIVNRGLVSYEVVEGIHRRMVRKVVSSGGQIEAVFYCPHRPDESCQCRKPKPGLLYRARDQLSVDLSKAVLVGDSITDIEAARAAGCGASILVRNGRPHTKLALAQRTFEGNFHVADDLPQAVDLILTFGI